MKKINMLSREKGGDDKPLSLFFYAHVNGKEKLSLTRLTYNIYSVYPPCKDCTKRKAACHDSCEEYKLYKEKILVEKTNREKDSEYHSYIFQSKHYPEYMSPRAKRYTPRNRSANE